MWEEFYDTLIVLTIVRIIDANKAGDRHYKTTVPLGFVEGFDLDGKRFEWSVKSGNTFELRVVNDAD